MNVSSSLESVSKQCSKRDRAVLAAKIIIHNTLPNVMLNVSFRNDFWEYGKGRPI